eukprot:XP_011418978.1 PREDICTED: uncharacterized protein LOC105322138 [Crassostrea gigas]
MEVTEEVLESTSVEDPPPHLTGWNLGVRFPRRQIHCFGPLKQWSPLTLIFPIGVWWKRATMNHRRGFTYGVKRKNKETTMWTCSVRSATIRCRATVLQRGNSFVRGANVHVHPADLKLPHLKKVSAQAKAIAVDQVFRPARDIVEATVSDTVQDRFVAPKTSNIKRYVNNYRTAFRPKDPTDLDFEINMDFLQCEEFLKADLRVGEEDT